MSGKMNNRQLYQVVFSKLQADPSIAARIPTQKPHFRLSRPLAACACLAVLLCAAPGVTYAVTGGETYNPVTAIRVSINGKDTVPAANKDGTYSFSMAPGDTAEAEQDSSHIHIETAPDGASAQVTVDPQNGEASVALSPAESEGSADGSAAPEEQTSAEKR